MAAADPVSAWFETGLSVGSRLDCKYKMYISSMSPTVAEVVPPLLPLFSLFNTWDTWPGRGMLYMKPPPSEILAVVTSSRGAECLPFLQTEGTKKGWKTGITRL